MDNYTDDMLIGMIREVEKEFPFGHGSMGQKFGCKNSNRQLMKIMNKILAILSSCFLTSCALTQAIEMKELQVYNISDRRIALIECKGIDLFGDSRDSLITTMYGKNGKIVPREYGPDGSTSINTWGDVVNINYPVIVKWAYASKPHDVHETRFNQIANLPKGQLKIREAGSIYLVFYQDAFHLIWNKGETGLYPDDFMRILDNMKKSQ